MELTQTKTSPDNTLIALTRPSGLSGLLGTGDHKALGRTLITLSVLVVAASQVLGFLLRLDSMDTKTHKLLDAGRALSLSTLQPSGVVLIGLIPLMLGIGLVVVPLQIGSRAVAFPRAAAAGVWGYFVAGTLFIISYFTGGGAPIESGVDTIKAVTHARSVDLWALSLVLLVVSLVVVSVVLVTTVFTQRAPGMRMNRIPLFSWSIVVAGVVWTLTLPILGMIMVLVWVDHSHGGIFAGTANAYSQMLWLFHQPQIYAVAIPALGIIGDITTTFTKTRDGFRRSVAMAYVGAFGALSFGAFTYTSFAVFGADAIPQTRFDNPVVIFASILIIFPALTFLGLIADKLIRGRSAGGPVKAAPLPGALVGAALIAAGVVAGAFTPIRSLALHGTLFDDAVMQLIIGGTIAAVSAALFHWSSKIAGAQALNGMGMVAALLALVGSVAIAVADIVAAITGSAAQHVLGNKSLNMLAVAGWAAIAGTVFLTIAALLVAVKRYVDADSDTATAHDPWGVGQSLEWATSSPPLYENFLEIPPVSSEAPLLDELVDDAKVTQ